MNDKQENRLGMFVRIETRLDNNLIIVNTKPALVTPPTSSPSTSSPVSRKTKKPCANNSTKPLSSHHPP
jgi:hypothetical protein